MMAAHFATANELQVPDRGGLHSAPECQRQRRARTLSRPPPCMVDQSQACLHDMSECPYAFRCKSKPHSGAGAGASRQAFFTGRVPAAETSTHLESGSALHGGAAASLLDQSELHWRLPLQTQTTYTCTCRCRYMVLAASTLNRSSASGRDEHAP